MQITVMYEIRQSAQITVEADDLEQAIKLVVEIPARKLKYGKKVWHLDRDGMAEKYLEQLHPHFVGDCTCKLSSTFSPDGRAFILGADDCPVHGFGAESVTEEQENEENKS